MGSRIPHPDAHTTPVRPAVGLCLGALVSIGPGRERKSEDGSSEEIRGAAARSSGRVARVWTCAGSGAWTRGNLTSPASQLPFSPSLLRPSPPPPPPVSSLFSSPPSVPPSRRLSDCPLLFLPPPPRSSAPVADGVDHDPPSSPPPRPQGAAPSSTPDQHAHPTPARTRPWNPFPCICHVVVIPTSSTRYASPLHAASAVSSPDAVSLHHSRSLQNLHPTNPAGLATGVRSFFHHQHIIFNAHTLELLQSWTANSAEKD